MYKRIILLILSVFSTSLLIAATKTWDGGGADNNWTTAANWDLNVAPSAGDALVFSGSTRLTPNNDFAAATSFASITFSSGAGNFTLSGNSITLSGGSTAITANNTSGTMTISLNITFITAAPTITSATGGSLTISGTIANGGNLITIDGTGTTTLSGVISGSGGMTIDTVIDNVTILTATNTYTANTSISVGGVRIKNSNAFGTSNTLIMTNGTNGQPSLRIDGSGGNISLPSSISINISSCTGNYGGIINEAGNNTISGDILLNSGGGDTELRVDGGTLTMAGNVTPGNFTNRSIVFSGTGDGTFSGILSDNSTYLPEIKKEGTGTWTISGANTFTGVTTISAGILKLNNTAALGSTTGITTVASGAALDLNGLTYSSAEPITINGTGVSSGGAIMNSSVTAASFGGLITLGSSSSIEAGTGNISLTNAGTITGSGFDLALGGAQTGSLSSIIGTSAGTLTKNDAGTWTISGTSTYTGATTINAGKLKLGAAGVIPDASAVTVTGTLDMNTFSETVGSIAGAGTIDNVAGAGTPILTCGGDGTSTTFSGIIQNTTGTLAITKSGSGTFTVSGANTYTGTTTVSAGVLKLSSTTALGTTAGATSVTSGAALDLNGQTYASSEALTLNGTGISSGGALMNSSSTAATYPGLITLGSASSIIGGTGTIAISNVGTITGATFGLTLGGAQGGTMTSIIGTTTGTLTKQDAGIWTLSGANTYDGLTTISAGTLVASNASALGSTSGATTLTATAAYTYLQISGVTITGETVTLNTNTTGDLRSVISSTGTSVWNGTITTAGTGTCLISPTSGTLTVQGTIGGAAGLLQIRGDGTATLDATVSIGSTGVMKVDNGTWTINSTGNTWGTTFILGGTLKLGASGVIPDASSVSLTTPGILDMNTYSETVGSITGTGTIDNVANAGTPTLTCGGNNATTTFSGIIQNTTGTLGITKTGSGTLTLSGANTYTGNTTVSAGILQLNNTAALGTNAAGTTVSSGAALDLNGIAYATTEALTISGTGVSSGGALINTGASASFAGTVTMAADATFNTANQITLSGTISPSTYSLTKAGTNSLVFTSNTATVNTLAISAGTLSAGSSTINIYGNFTNSGTFTCGTGAVAFKGTAAQSIAAATFNNLTIDNTTSPATSAATMAGAITVGGALTMTTGILNTSIYTITLGSSATISETNPSATAPTSYVTGYVSTTRDLIQNVANTFGGIGVSLTETTQASNSTEVTRRTGTASVGAGNQSILRYFDITPTVDVALNGSMVFSYIDSELNSQTETNFKLYKSDTPYSTWTKQTSSSVNTGSNTISLSSITSFSRWTASNYVTSALPVEFVSFKANKTETGNLLNWKTAQETNNDYFDIERSHDGVDFEKISQLKGAGTTNSTTDYTYIDKTANQTLASYYRLKQVDFDKKFEYSNLVFINGESGHKEFNLYPNPLEEGTTLYACIGDDDEGLIKVSVFDITGKLLQDFLLDNIEKGSNITLENENLLLKKGMYIIEIKTINNDYKQKLEVK